MGNLKNSPPDVYVYRPDGGIDTPDLSGEPWCATFIGHEGTASPFLCAYFVTEGEALEFQRLWRKNVGLPEDLPNERGQA